MILPYQKTPRNSARLHPLHRLSTAPVVMIHPFTWTLWILLWAFAAQIATRFSQKDSTATSILTESTIAASGAMSKAATSGPLHWKQTYSGIFERGTVWLRLLSVRPLVAMRLSQGGTIC
ncbi:hypothetical protein EJ04DRAFT_63242 [Polyplosphaeria fusca]|uniref:Uncharacterized protein n=1 Tax=Polyplosphaeria fusca TaxID=682080 RepID=A0A9P4QNE4_9PLEO|nr:hypothetical protein EJ04DRAFT_63242 [Polyplosphaeria fusca]